MPETFGKIRDNENDMTHMDDILGSRFGFTARPFNPLADASVFHWSKRHTRACAALEYGLLSGAQFSVLTGPSGCGKTALLLRLMTGAGAGFRFVRTDAGLGDSPILAWILQALDAPQSNRRDTPTALAALQDQLIEDYAAGHTTVIVIDEAHNLSNGDLESLRLLSNINTASDQLLQIILSGQPSLRARLTAPAFAGLAQRINIWASVDAMDLHGTVDYIADRLRTAGVAIDLFEPGALSLIHSATGGIPRQINTLCELALIFAMPEDGDRIGVGPIRQVLTEGFFLPVTDDSADDEFRPARLTLASGT